MRFNEQDVWASRTPPASPPAGSEEEASGAGWSSAPTLVREFVYLVIEMTSRLALPYLTVWRRRRFAVLYKRSLRTAGIDAGDLFPLWVQCAGTRPLRDIYIYIYI